MATLSTQGNGHVKIARHGAQMAAAADTAALNVSAEGGVKQDTKHAIPHAAAHLAAGKQKHRTVEVSER
jgi:hypothetical protein